MQVLCACTAVRKKSESDCVIGGVSGVMQRNEWGQHLKNPCHVQAEANKAEGRKKIGQGGPARPAGCAFGSLSCCTALEALAVKPGMWWHVFCGLVDSRGGDLDRPFKTSTREIGSAFFVKRQRAHGHDRKATRSCETFSIVTTWKKGNRNRDKEKG